MDIAVFSVIYEANLKYFDDFIFSLNKQLFKNFELFLINDQLSIEVLQKKLQTANFPYVLYTLKRSLTPAKIREVGFREISNRNYKKIIFADTDDLMSSNRLERSIALLDYYPVVFTDITLVDEDKDIIKSSIWKERLIDTKIDENFLLDKNVLGLGNTAMLSSFMNNIAIPQDIIAVDWYYFTRILKNEHAGFISDAVTYYRQHADNTIGIKGLTYSRLKLILDVKIQHYREMSIFNPKYLPLLEDIYSIKKQLNEGIVSIDEINNREMNFFWWEETNYFINKLF